MQMIETMLCIMEKAALRPNPPERMRCASLCIAAII